ncbi:MAG TPA: hypothetical protein VMU89_08440 [Thermomicrobiaceae bacterium]|nr:hypothetical protein [Thermomicrobiaceae bacterium]
MPSSVSKAARGAGGSFVFLPRGIEHGYRIRSTGDVRLLMVTSPAQEDAAGGWSAFVGDIEGGGERRGTPPDAA